MCIILILFSLSITVPHNSSLISMTVTPVISGNMVHIIILVNVRYYNNNRCINNVCLYIS